MKNQTRLIEEDAERICQSIDLSSLASKQILLTGASGLLGLHFLACLRHMRIRNGTPLKVIAVIHSPLDPVLHSLTQGDFVEVLRGDIADLEFQKTLPKADVIIHSAGYGQPGRFTADPVKTLEINTSGTLGLLRKLNSGGKFLFTSSAEVYTGLEDSPFNETQIGTTNTNHPRSSYIEGKRAGEAFCNAYRSSEFDVKSARISLTYGPGTKVGDTRVLNMLIDKGIQGRINLLDEGKAVRSFLYVSDAIAMMWQILLHGKSSLYNVGGTHKISIFELAQQIGKMMNVSVFTSNQSGLKGAPSSVQLDMSRFEKEFQYRSQISLETGLQRTIEWQKNL
jgi:nucleoside-diphosphate-sugar epimerase